ncbi:hypothetical protein PYCC9005_004504 [Savitreella phatthalungensis]
MARSTVLSPDEITTLGAATLDARRLSYSPYSRFRVGAVVLDSAGGVYRGANVENAAYSGICAERVALTKCVTDGDVAEKLGSEGRKLKAVGVASDAKTSWTTPCGSCRQFLREFSAGELEGKC